MEPFRAFERLRDVALNERLPREQRQRITRHFEFLREQALCDVDRRKSLVILGATWRDVRKILEAAGVQPVLEAETAWKIACGFCASPASMPAPEPRAEVPRPRPATEEEFFQRLLQSALGLEGIDGTEKWVLYLSLKVFLSELALPMNKREQRRLLPLWKFVLPLLKKHALLELHPPDEVLKSKIGFFLRGTFGEGSRENQVRRARKYPDHDYTGKQGIDTRNLPRGD